MPIAFEPPPTQAIAASGRLPSASSTCARASPPINASLFLWLEGRDEHAPSLAGEHADRVRATAHAGDRGVGQAALGLQYLRSRLAADQRLLVSLVGGPRRARSLTSRRTCRSRSSHRPRRRSRRRAGCPRPPVPALAPRGRSTPPCFFGWRAATSTLPH